MRLEMKVSNTLMSNKMLCLARITRKDEFVEEKVQEGFSEEQK